MILAVLAATAALASAPPMQSEGSGLLKDLWLSPRLLPDPAHPGGGLDKDLKIAPPGAPGTPALLPMRVPPRVRVLPAGAVNWSMPPPQAERTPNLYSTPERCKDAPIKAVDKDGKPRPRKLTDLPDGALQLAVDRRIDGCPVLTIVYGNVTPDDAPRPAFERIDPAIAVAPAKRGDAPSNRR